VGYAAFLITSKVLDVRRRGATTEAYGVIRRKPAPAKPAPAKAGGGGRSDRRQRGPSALLRARTCRMADDTLMADQEG
jgi:hypothetical protein